MSFPIVPFLTVCDFQGGTQPPKSTFINVEEDGYIRLLQIQDFKRSDKKVFIPIKKTLKTCQSHDILIARYGASLGKILTGLAGAYNVALTKTIPDLKVLDKKYLYYFLVSDSFQGFLKSVGSRAAQAGFNKDDFAELKIPLPPLETQKQIAAVLEKADQLCKDCQQMEQELNSLAQSVFIEMFGGQLASPHHSLGDVSNVVSGVTKGQKHNNKVIVKAPYMRVANVQAGYLNLDEIKEIEVRDTDVEKYKLQIGDVLLTEGGDHDKLGRGAIWNGEIENCIHQNHVFRVRLDTSLYTPEWLNGYLKTTFAKRYFLKCAKKTTNLASINITQLKGLPMPSVDISEQKRFECILKVINKQVSANQSISNECEQHFNALMQKAFNGELNLDNTKTQ
jgi:type I restriction enzyme S subunit